MSAIAAKLRRFIDESADYGATEATYVAIEDATIEVVKAAEGVLSLYRLHLPEGTWSRKRYAGDAVLGPKTLWGWRYDR